MKIHIRHKDVMNHRVCDYSQCLNMIASFNHSNRTFITDDRTKVTCKTCLKMMEKSK